MRRYDDAAAIFTGPAGEMVRAIDGPEGVTNLYAPAREASPVRFEYQPSADAWVEHDPSGVKRHYGRNPAATASTGRVVNELGTHAWLLMREVDRHGNYVDYFYSNTIAETRPDKRTAQVKPILSMVRWGGNTTTGQSPPFFVRTTLESQDGPLNMLEGHTLLSHRIRTIEVGIDGIVQWSYTLSYLTSETGKSLLSSVSRGGDAPETTTFSYTTGNPHFAAAKPLTQDVSNPIYINNTRSQNAVPVWYRRGRDTPERAFQATGFRSGFKFLDVDGNGTTDAIYHAPGIGTTATHVLWEESSLQSASSLDATTGLGIFALPAAGSSTQPQTGLPYFPVDGNWGRGDFPMAALQDLVDLDGDGDVDGIALPFSVNVVAAPRVIVPWVPPHLAATEPPGQTSLRILTNSARGAVQHWPDQTLDHWPVDVQWGFRMSAQILATSGKVPGTTPPEYAAEPVSDFQMPPVDLNADGKTDLVLLKRRHTHANYLPPGAPLPSGAAIGAYAMPIDAMLRLYGGMVDREDGEAFDGSTLEEMVQRGTTDGAIVLVDDALLNSSERPSLYVRLVTTADRLLIPDVPPQTMIMMMSMPGRLPVPGEDFTPPGPPDGPFIPAPQVEDPWWKPIVDPDGDVYIPLRDGYDIGSTYFGFKLFFGSFRFVPRAYMMRGDAVRRFEPEIAENSSQFESSLRERLNPGWTNECTSLACRYPAHVNFSSFFTDLNGDGLPDLVAAVPPHFGEDGAGWRLGCLNGHDVYLNRGETFERVETETLGSAQSWSSGTDPANVFNRVANRDRWCQVVRPRMMDIGGAPVFPTSAMAHVDINADGRIDIILAHQKIHADAGTSRTASVEQEIHLNTGRGFVRTTQISLPPDAAMSRNVAYPGQQPDGTGGWPRVGAPDRARFVDMDNDGLVDIVVAGDCYRTGALTNNCVAAKWYRNEGNIPDRLSRISSLSGAWTSVEYAPAKSDVVQLPDDGLRPPATMRVVKTVRSAAGPVPTPAGYDPFAEQVIRLSYWNYVKDLVSNEALGFEKVTADFVNRFGSDPRETVRVTRTFDVRAEVYDAAGALVPVRHPLKGAAATSVTESAGWVSTDVAEFSVSTLGNGARIRPRRELHGETSPSGASAWSAEETTQLDSFGYPMEQISGNFDGAVIGPADQRRSVLTEYNDNRTTGSDWQLGLVTRERSFGYSEDILGTPDPAHLLGETRTAYDAKGNVQATSRVNIRDASCDGPSDDISSYTYLPNGLLQHSTEMAGYDPVGGLFTRDVATSYEAKSLYPNRVEVAVGERFGGEFLPATNALEARFETDLRTGQTTRATPPSGAATISVYDSRGRLRWRTMDGSPSPLDLVDNSYSDVFPLRVTSAITTDEGKVYFRRTHLDADGNVLSVVEGTSGASSWARRQKTRYDAFGRAVESFLPAWVNSIDAGVAPSTGPKHVTTYDGFDRPTHVLYADGTTSSTAYEPRATVETNARSFATRRTYDAFGDLESVQRNPGGSASETSTHGFVRDGRGEILRVIDGDGSVRRFERDGGGRLLRVTLPHSPGTPAAQFSLCHDVDDRLVHMETPEGRVVDVVHDELGRTLSTQGLDANGLFVESTQTYDGGPWNGNGLGRLTSRSDESGVTNFTYDSFGRPATVTFAPSDRAKAGATNVAASYGASFTYSRVGHLLSVSFTGLPQAASLTYGRDWMGKVHTVTSTVGTSSTNVATGMYYDARDRMLYSKYSNATSAAWTFNALTERLDRTSYSSSWAGLMAAVNYVYDANGNISYENRERQGYSGYHTQKHHAYDALDRVRTTEVLTPSGTTYEASSYSAGGNIQYAGGDTYSYASPASAQAVSLVQTAAGGQRALGYDADGYLETDAETRPDGSRSTRALAFDPLGCMRAITREDVTPAGVPSWASSEYTCGGDGRVVARATTRANGTRSRRIDFAGLAEIRADEGVMVLRVPLGGAVMLEDARSLSTGARDTAQSKYLMSDVRGSVLGTTAFGYTTSWSQEAEFDAWGKKLEGYSGLTSPRHGFVGAEADAAVGTYTFGARTYDPTLRRWVSPDPLLAALPGLDEAIGDNLNLYAYAGNNPIARIDLSGFWGEELKAALQNSPLANAVAGFAYGVTQGTTPGGVLMPNPARDAPQGAVFQHWQGAGQIIGGAVGVVANGDMVVKAAAADGISAGAATPVLAVSAAGVANGALAVQAGAKNIADAQARGVASSGPAKTPNQVDSTKTGASDQTVRGRAPTSESGGGKTGRKVSKDARETGKTRADDARARWQAAKSKPNKTPADKAAEKKLRNEVKQAEKRLRGSEEHARKQQGPSR